MTKLDDILKKLNKDRAEEDKFKIASEVDTFDINFSSTGSIYFDQILNNKPIPLGSMTLLSGWEGSGKSSNALIFAREIQKKTGKTVVIFDGEQSFSDSHLERFAIDKDKLILYKDSVLEYMLDNAEEFSKTDDIGGIIIDSVKSFFSLSVEAKSAENDTIGIEAKKMSARMPIIHANCARRGIGLIVLNQWRTGPTTHGDPRVLPGGNWQKFLPSLHLDFTKKEYLVDDDKNVIGHIMDVRVKKSKFGAYDKSRSYNLNFYYDGGFNTTDEYASLFLELGTVEQKGGWIYFPDINGEEQKVNGKSKFLEYLRENPDVLNMLISSL